MKAGTTARGTLAGQGTKAGPRRPHRGGEAKAGAAAGRLAEVEHPLPKFLGDARPVVVDEDVQPPGIVELRGHPHAPLPGPDLRRISEQIDQRRDPVTAGSDQYDRRGNVHDDGDSTIPFGLCGANRTLAPRRPGPVPRGRSPPKGVPRRWRTRSFGSSSPGSAPRVGLDAHGRARADPIPRAIRRAPRSQRSLVQAPSPPTPSKPPPSARPGQTPPATPAPSPPPGARSASAAHPR